jgi:hypothetical protein
MNFATEISNRGQGTTRFIKSAAMANTSVTKLMAVSAQRCLDVQCTTLEGTIG